MPTADQMNMALRRGPRRRPSRMRRLKWRIQRRLERLHLAMPWVPSEGAATARVIHMCFDGYPMLEDFETKEDAVRLLAAIWDVVDNWDGSRINVAWARGEKNVYEWARAAPGEENDA